MTMSKSAVISVLLGCWLQIFFEEHSCATPVSLECPSQQWLQANASCYLGYQYKATWQEAQRICQSEGGWLVDIHDRLTAQLVANITAGQKSWTGLMHQSNPSLGLFLGNWASGSVGSEFEPVWDIRQPDYTPGHCTGIYGNNTGQPVWSALDCQDRLSFVCERRACSSGSAFCKNGGCIDNRQLCDKRYDCKDESDEINCPSSCQQILYGESGQIFSQSVSPGTTEASACTWTIRGSIGSNIKLEFTQFETQENYDDVTILVGGPTVQSSTFVNKLSGTLQSSEAVIISPNNYMIIKYLKYFASGTRGFEAQWTALKHGVSDGLQYLIATDNVQELSSPFFPDHTPMGHYLIWIISPLHERKYITLKMKEIDFGEGESLKVRNGNKYGEVLGQFQNTEGPNIIISVGKLFLEFSSPFNYQRTLHKGFKLTYQQGCDVELQSNSGMVFSPGYGVVHYGNFQSCSWMIHPVASNRQVTLIFDDKFELENMKDFLQVYIGQNSSGAALHTAGSKGFTGSSSPSSLTSPSGEFFVRMHANALFNAYGYRAKYSIGCLDPQLNPQTVATPILTTSTYNYGVSLNITCQTGHAFSAQEYLNSDFVIVKCIEGGIWNVRRMPQCQPKYCGFPPPLTNGYIKSSTGVVYGSKVTFMCQDGFEAQAPSVISCQADGTWEVPPECSAVHCSSQPMINNGKYTITNGNGSDFISLLTYNCDPGYYMDGLAVLFCGSNGTWNRNPPSCHRVQCLVPTIANGKGNITGDFVKFEETVLFSCDTGYTLSGTDLFTCGSDRILAQIPPSCVDVDECLGTPCSSTEYCLNKVGSYQCLCIDGYLKNQSTGQCEDIDECGIENGGCSQKCINSNGSYSCSCNSGFTLYTANGTESYNIPVAETGLLKDDIFYLNHTCVAKSCPSPPSLINGAIFQVTSTFHVGDVVSFKCTVGYVLEGKSILRCRDNSQWDSAYPTCKVAQCQLDIVLAANYTNVATVTAKNPVDYGKSLALTCDVSGKSTFYQQRTCVYDPVIAQYKLQGDSYECGEINCGAPPDLPNGYFSTYNGTTFNNSFTVTCNEFYHLIGNSSHGDSTVRCQSDGYWDFGNMRCLAMHCPSLARVSGVEFLDTNYSVYAEMRFKCEKDGFSLSDPSPIKCVPDINKTALQWNGTIPTCSDTSFPVLTGCPPTSAQVPKFRYFTFPNVSVTDNVGVETFDIFIEGDGNFTQNMVIAEDLTVVYRAVDYAKNTVNCTIDITVQDLEPPSVTCPPSRVEYQYYNGEERTVNITDGEFSVSDNKKVTSFSFSPKNVLVSDSTINQAYLVTATAADAYGNKGYCQSQIFIKAAKCLPKTLEPPVNGKLNCTQTNGGTGYSCRAFCDPGYYFYDSYANNIFVTECNNGSDWSNPYVPSCVATSPTTYYQYHTLQYSRVNSTDDIPEYCFDSFGADIENAYTEVTNQLNFVCSLLGQSKSYQPVVVGGEFKRVNYSWDDSWFTAKYTVRFQPEDLGYNDLCITVIRSVFNLTTDAIKKIKDIPANGGCPAMEGAYNASLRTEAPKCQEDVKHRDIGYFRVCLKCPPGMFKNSSSGSCEMCEVGTYTGLQGSTSCIQCPPGTSTIAKGSTSASACLGICRSGLISSTGVPPCDICPKNSYYVDSRHCQACPNNKKFIGFAEAKNKTCLREPCQYVTTLNKKSTRVGQPYSGTEAECKSYCDNFEVSTSVPCVGFSYQFQTSTCVIHYGDTGTLVNDINNNYFGRTCNRIPLEECYCREECVAGTYSLDGFSPCTTVPPNHYTDSNQATSYKECPDGSYVKENGSTSINQCLDAAKDFCGGVVSPCKNGASCRIENHDYVCDCPLGYEGRHCESVVNHCGSNPCLNQGVCQNINNTYKCTCLPGINGTNCENEPNDCAPSPCKNGGVCVDGILNFTCLCPPDFKGQRCGQEDPICNRDPCMNGGICIPIDNIQRKCSCASGYAGRDCETNIDECSSSPCLNGGTCVDGVNSFTCTCLSPYGGSRCEVSLFNCTSKACTNSYGCYDDYTTGKPVCLCNEGYTRDQVSETCVQNDGCKGNPCYNNGTCQSIDGQYHCTCQNEYTGSRCQHNVDDCASLPCKNGATCKDGINSFTCACVSGFEGMDCSLDINECKEGPCDPVGTQLCNNTHGSYHCVCHEGYLGNNCSIDIDECASSPCYHGSKCTDKVNDYECACTNGWKGKNCDIAQDYCIDVHNPCKNKAQCFDLQTDYYCRCLTGTEGRTCTSMESLCDRAKPCLNSSACSVNGQNTTSCNCLAGYYGSGCQYMLSYDCSKNPCQNGGTCLESSTSNSYSCVCRPGYTGQDCNVEIDFCAGFICPSLASCISSESRAYCRCPLGKLLPNCSLDVNYHFDLCFDSPTKTSSAFLPYGIGVNQSAFSISLWVKYKESNKEGTFFNLFRQVSEGNSQDRSMLLQLSNSGVTMNLNGTEMFQYYASVSVNDGQWHLIVVLWEPGTMQLSVIIDTIRQVQRNIFGVGHFVTNFWVTLGNQYSTSLMGSDPNKGFQGCLSQVNIFDKILNFNTEIPALILNPHSRQYHGNVLSWHEYILQGRVWREEPSTVAKQSCVNCSNQGTLTPPVLTCPPDQYIVSSTEYTKVVWPSPQLQNVANIFSTYDAGSLFLQGKYTVVYHAVSHSNISAICSFDIYIQKSNCSAPVSPLGGGTQSCYSGSWPYVGCSLSCPASKRLLSAPTPNYFTCGPLGYWQYHMNEECPLKYPSCGFIIGTAGISLTVTLKYNMSTVVCDQIKSKMTSELRTRFSKLNADWSDQICDKSNCTDTVVDITCVPGTNIDSRTVVMAILQNRKQYLNSTSNTEILPADQVILREALDNQMFDFKEIIPGGYFNPDAFNISGTKICPMGQYLMGNDCLHCGLGMEYNTNSAACEFCPPGSYQDKEDGSTLCQNCPLGTTTQCPGAHSKALCYSICSAGQYFNMTTSSCELCPIKSYQDETGQFKCKSCPFGKTTQKLGVTSISQCYDECSLGYEMSATGMCNPCDIGLYRGLGDGQICLQCPSGYITNSTAASAKTECNIVACEVGLFRNTQGYCEKCPLNYYQDKRWQTFCHRCPDSHLTENMGTISINDCIFYCPSGYENLINKTCYGCPGGTYKNNTEMSPISSCKKCPVRYTTPSVASTSVLNCTVLMCEAGTKADATNTVCEKCPVGFYQPNEQQTQCISCPDNTTTRDEGASNINQCEAFCQSGYERMNNQCVACAIGYYKDNTKGVFSSCQQCPTGYVTAQPASVSINLCSISDCSAGYKEFANKSGCEPCSRGEYQPDKYQASCLPCPSETYTRQEASTSQADCEAYCPSGEQSVKGQCVPCDIGYFKDNNDDVFGLCVLCPIDNITAGKGSTLKQSCDVGNCTAGQYLDGKVCKPCPVGKYQDQKWQTKCLDCPSFTTTASAGTDDKSKCFLSCQPGFEPQPNNTCSPCPMGYYKESVGVASCTSCPSGVRTASTGAANKTLCSIPYCEPGTFLQASTNLCRLCPFNKYQPEKWQDSCLPCPPQTVTFQLGAVNITECTLDCDSGYEYNAQSQQCQSCSRGYYRDKSILTMDKCTLCPSDFITPSNKLGMSANDCNIANCSTPGSFRDSADNKCKPCPIGKYQYKKWQDDCLSCLSGYTTRTTGNVFQSACELDCNSGYQAQVGFCQICPVGTYRDKDSSWTCQTCAAPFTTASQGAKSAAACDIPDCKEGQYFSSAETKCLPCLKGFYQPEKYKTSCIVCPNGKNTPTEGATSVSDCISLCGTSFNNCSVNANCTDLNGSIKCACKAGYRGDGYTCSHLCDQPLYCNTGSCLRRESENVCICSDLHEGPTCAIRRDASKELTGVHDYIVGTSIGGVVFIALMILIAATVVSIWKKRLNKTPMSSHSNSMDGIPSFVGPGVTKADLKGYLNENPYSIPLPHESFSWSPHADSLPNNSFIEFDNEYFEDDSFYQRQDSNYSNSHSTHAFL